MPDRDAIDELVDWQLSNQQRKQPPELPDRPTLSRCPNCGGDWHGFKRVGCGGSHLNKDDAEFQKGKSSNTPSEFPYWYPWGM